MADIGDQLKLVCGRFLQFSQLSAVIGDQENGARRGTPANPQTMILGGFVSSGFKVAPVVAPKASGQWLISSVARPIASTAAAAQSADDPFGDTAIFSQLREYPSEYLNAPIAKDLAPLGPIEHPGKCPPLPIFSGRDYTKITNSMRLK